MPSSALYETPVTYLLDTNMVSYIVTGQSPAARERMASLSDDSICCISTVSEGEIQYGLFKRPKDVAFRSLMDGFFASVRILAWDRDEAYTYGRLRTKLQSAGTPLGSLDMMIAAHAVTIGAVLVTNDKAFGRVDELFATVNWATDLSEKQRRV
jgi:tRNA(fMet)-specific endonuclease VapC